MNHFNELMVNYSNIGTEATDWKRQWPKFSIEHNCGHLVLKISLGDHEATDVVPINDLYVTPNILPYRMDWLAESFVKSFVFE